jgi:hypothetical protein
LSRVDLARIHWSFERERRSSTACSVVMNLLGAPTSLGNRPYEDNGSARLTNRGPARLREQRLVQRLGARDLGDVVAAEYRDFVRPPRGIRNEDLVLDHVRAVARALEPPTDSP